MSQKLTNDGAQKGFAVGRGLLAAAETLNFSMGEAHSDPYSSVSQSHSGMAGLIGGEGKDHDSQLPHRAGNHISNTMKLFSSLGLSPTDLDALAQIPEENISVETLPHLIMQLKNRKMEVGRRIPGDPSRLSSETSYRGGREDWGDMQGGRLDRSNGQSQSRSQGDFGYSSIRDTSGQGYDMLDYSSSGGRDGQYSELSHDSYIGMSTSSASDDMFMQRRMGTPSQGKVQDFLGVMPPMFPHVCALCDFDVHSVMEWTRHTTGIRHSENRRLLLQMYPDWDPHLPSTRMSTSLSLDTKSRQDGLLGAAPMGAGLQRSGMSSNWGADSSMGMKNKMSSYSAAPKIRSRVVVAKYDRKPLSPNSLFALAKPFGTIRVHLVLNNKAFLELQTHEEALAMANYYQRKPAILQGKEIQIYLSKELMVIKKSGRPDRDTKPVKEGESQVVFFSNLPQGSDKKMELLTVARRFGTVEKHLFLNAQAFVQFRNHEDAEMLVKYYTLHHLTISGRSIRLNICTKYKTLTVPPGKDGQGKEEHTRKSSSSSGTSRTGDKPSSRSQRSSSSKAKESSDEKKVESKPEDEDAVQGDRSNDEEADVMEARDGDEEDFDEGPSADDVNSSHDPEQASTQPEDIDTTVEDEDPEAQQTKDGTDDAETAEKQDDVNEKQVETMLEKPVGSEGEQEEITAELPKELEEQNDEQPEDDVAEEDKTEQEDQGETDFPENIDEFVTLDEIAEEEDAEKQYSKSKAKKSGSAKESGGLRVVNVVGFKRGYSYLDELLALAKPFGRVVRHLILDVRPEAFLELSSEQEARAMSSFYSGNVIASVCGKPVKVYHSHTYPTIQTGKVIYVGNVPPFKTSDASILKIAEPFGKVRRYFVNRLRNECFIEMEKGEDAEKMVEAYKENAPKFEGKRLLVYKSRKYKQLKHGHRPPSPETDDKKPSKRERSGDAEAQSSNSGKNNGKKEEEPSAKKIKVEIPATDKPEVENQEESERQSVSEEAAPEVEKEPEEEPSKDTAEVQNMETETEAKDEEAVATPPVVELEKSMETEEKATTPTQTPPLSETKLEMKPETEIKPETKPETSLATLGAHDPNVPVGVEFVKMGYYCRVCFLFYSNEDTAKKVHCCSQAHYDKLKKHLEKEKAKVQSNVTKK
ncbi:matrin-3-like [Xyrauchen texanus]|uniref:matrin-3-like n=1 Tax=Xyrauchen texanus TaxID=154827 RepID=UPI002242C2AF|nr:matrin-3-like [Xyrauchen texanus]